MSDATELAAAFAEIVAESPVTVTDQRGFGFTGRKGYGISTEQDMQEVGHLIDSEIELFVPVANLPTTRPAKRERLTVESRVYRVTEIEQGAGAWLIRGQFANEAALPFLLLPNGEQLLTPGGKALLIG